MKKVDPQLHQTYVVKLNDRVWPVVVCREERMPDRALDNRQGKHDLAVIVLGCRQYCWINPANLRPYNPEINYTASTKQAEPEEGSSLAAEEEKRRIAFKQDAPMQVDADFWHNFIDNEKGATPLFLARQPRSISTSPTASAHSRDSDGQPKATSRKRAGSPALDAGRVPKKRLSQAQRSALIEGDGPVSYYFPTHDAIMTLKDEATAYEYIAVVGSRALPMLITRPGVERVPVLADSLFPSKDYGHYLPLTMIMPQISAKEFKAVAEYLAIGTITPKIRDLPPPVEWEEGDDVEPVIDCAKTISLAYHAASWLELEDLQVHCMKKLRHMGALSGPALMGVEVGSRGCKVWGMEEQSPLHELAVHGLARDFFRIMEIDGVVFSNYLQEKKTPLMEIIRRLCVADAT